jgi:hypothetical protein
LRTVPRTAIPKAPPTSRARSFTAEATPWRWAGSEETIAVVAGAVASAIPMPVSSAPAPKRQYEESTSSVVKTRKPIPISARPTPPVTRTPRRRASFGAAAFLRHRRDVEPGRIGGIGLSVGGEMLLQAAAESNVFKAVVSEGAGARSIRENLEKPLKLGTVSELAVSFVFTAGTALSPITSRPRT